MSDILTDPRFTPGPDSPAWLAAMGEADRAAESHLDYQGFISRKIIRATPCGFEPGALSPLLFDFQDAVTRWAIRKGRAALFEDCGLGKTFQELEWGRAVSEHTNNPVLIFAPLAVSRQTLREAEKFGLSVTICSTQSDIQEGVNITNYEKLAHFTPDGLGGVILDESSILKGFDGATRKALTEFASGIPYRLCCTATPAPNDYMELGNHAEFLGVMKLSEMLATFFVHDGGDTAKWRLKKHATEEFWKWVCSWAVAIRKPSDLGFEDKGFILPPLRIIHHTVEDTTPLDGTLFAVEAKTLDERRTVRRNSLDERVAKCAEIIGESKEPWVIWCNLNAESEALTEAIDPSEEVTGSDSEKHKEQTAIDFAAGRVMRIVSKPLIFGFGMNWQHCRNVAFVGLSDSYEQFYQAIRRCWRFGQTQEVRCHIVTSEAEGAVVRNIERKERDASLMMDGMVDHMKTEMQREVRGIAQGVKHERREESGEGWRVILNDCVDECASMSANSIDYSIFSPPFASLYTYSQSERDMGNCRNHSEFYEHFRFLVRDLFRVLKPGRLLSFHCMNLPMSKERDGVIGIWDFRGELIRIFADAGFIYHSEVVIWKDPVTAMQRTKALGLLYKQLRKDSCMSRQGIPDYLVTMRKPGENLERVTKTHDGFPVGLWQKYASPVWMDINPSDTLQRESAREDEDERHICPLQLQVIERAIELWTNPGDLVLSPFAGIGSEGYVAIQQGRRYVGVELKESYWKQACANLRAAHVKQSGLFSDPGAA